MQQVPVVLRRLLYLWTFATHIHSSEFYWNLHDLKLEYLHLDIVYRHVMASCLHRKCRLYHINSNFFLLVSNRGHDRMVVEFTTTDAISSYRHWCCGFESRSGRGEQHYVIKFVSDLRQVGGFLRVLHQ
jgi:hypothetical protein